MNLGPASLDALTHGEQRALASFLAGRLPAGQLHTALCRAREAALATAAAHEAPANEALAPSAVPAPSLHAA